MARGADNRVLDGPGQCECLSSQDSPEPELVNRTAAILLIASHSRCGYISHMSRMTTSFSRCKLFGAVAELSFIYLTLLAFVFVCVCTPMRQISSRYVLDRRQGCST